MMTTTATSNSDTNMHTHMTQLFPPPPNITSVPLIKSYVVHHVTCCTSCRTSCCTSCWQVHSNGEERKGKPKNAKKLPTGPQVRRVCFVCISLFPGHHLIKPTHHMQSTLEIAWSARKSWRRSFWSSALGTGACWQFMQPVPMSTRSLTTIS